MGSIFELLLVAVLALNFAMLGTGRLRSLIRSAALQGVLLGVTRGTSRAHIVRATLEAIAFEVTDVVTLMVSEGGVSLPALRVDGGAAANDFLCQAQATALGVDVVRASALETTGLGAAFLAGLGTGFWPSQQALADLTGDAAVFSPHGRDERSYRRWRTAVERSKGWALV